MSVCLIQCLVVLSSAPFVLTKTRWSWGGCSLRPGGSIARIRCVKTPKPPFYRPPPSHHAAVEILLHLAEGVRRHLPFARQDDADVGDGQGGVRLALRRPAVRDVDPLGGVAADVGRAAGRRGLDELAARHQALLPLVQHAEGQRGGVSPPEPQFTKEP